MHGRKAILYIYDDSGEEVEQVTLSDYKTKEEMHALMVDKGFVKRSEEEIAERRLQREKGRKKAEEAKKVAEEAQKAASGQGVDFVEAAEVEDVGEEKARVWKAAADAAQKALKEKKKNWKEIAYEAEAEESKKLDGEKRERRRRAMEL